MAMIDVEPQTHHRGIFGLGRKVTPEVPRFSLWYMDVTLDMLRASNLPDQNFEGFRYGLRDQASGLLVEMVVDKNSDRIAEFRGTEVSLIRNAKFMEAEESVEGEMMNFASLAAKIHGALRPIGKLYWSFKADAGGIMEARMNIFVDGKRLDLFPTKEGAATFVESLPTYGVELIRGNLSFIDFRGLTMDEILASNFPKETWPPYVTHLRTYKEMPLPR